MAWLKWMRTKNRTAKSCWSFAICSRSPSNSSTASGKYDHISFTSTHTHACTSSNTQTTNQSHTLTRPTPHWRTVLQANCLSVTHFKFLQRSAPVWPSTVAGVLWPHVRRVHETVEVPAATSARAGLEIWPEALADRRDRQQDRTVVLSLLVSVCARHELCDGCGSVWARVTRY